MAFEDSFVVVFHGPRRGGKTLSAVVQAIIDLLNGRKVWSNFPISFYFYGKYYATMPLDYHALLRQDPQFENGVIVWDETALWVFARNSQAFFNKMMSLIITLIGKMELNLYVTVQFLKLLDSNVRLQMDALIMCTDLSFKYPHLGRGTTIGQMLQDISGRFTGETYDYSGEIYQRTLHGKPFWFCYNTKELFVVEETQRKLTKGELYGAIENHDNYNIQEENLIILKHVIEEFKANEELIVPSDKFFQTALDYGYQGSTSQAGRVLTELGIDRKYSAGRIKYVLEKVSV